MFSYINVPELASFAVITKKRKKKLPNVSSESQKNDFIFFFKFIYTGYNYNFFTLFFKSNAKKNPILFKY